MKRIRIMTLDLEALVHRVDAGCALAAAVTIGLVVLTIGLAVAAAVGAGIAPAVHQSIALNSQHQLLIHIGPQPPCLLFSSPPTNNCVWPGAERRVFSVDYLTPNGARSLIWFRLPGH